MQTISHWTADEVIAAGVVPTLQNDALRLAVPLGLPERRIYLYLEVAQSVAAQFDLMAEVEAFNGGRPVARWPAHLADFTGVTRYKSVASLFNAGGSPVGDSCVLRLAAPFVATITSAVLQPLRVNGEFDEIKFSIRGLSGTNLTGWRAFLGCLSTRY